MCRLLICTVFSNFDLSILRSPFAALHRASSSAAAVVAAVVARQVANWHHVLPIVAALKSTQTSLCAIIPTHHHYMSAVEGRETIDDNVN